MLKERREEENREKVKKEIIEIESVCKRQRIRTRGKSPGRADNKISNKKNGDGDGNMKW